MTLAAILDDCLQRLRAGETVAACLARYPEQAGELAPLLAAAARLRPLAGRHLSDAQRARGRAALRAAAAIQTTATANAGTRSVQSRKMRPIPDEIFKGISGWTGKRAFGRSIAVIAVVLVLALAGTTVFASQPGDLGYPLRVMAERAPVILQSSPAGRADAELRIADRRLADLESHLRTTRRVEPAALAALLRGDEAAARRAIDLPQLERTRVAEQIERHADAIYRLAARAETPAAANRLAQVARRMEQVATELRLGRPLQPRSRQDSLAPPVNATGPRPDAGTSTPTATLSPTEGQTPPSLEEVPPVITETPPLPAPTHTPPAGPIATAPLDAPTPTPKATGRPAHTTTPTATTIATNTPTRKARPSLTPRPTRPAQPSLTPPPTRPARPTRPAQPSLTPQPTRPPRPPLTPRPTRTPRPSLTPRPGPTIRASATIEPTLGGATAAPTPSDPQPTMPATPTATPPAQNPIITATPTPVPGPSGPVLPPTSLPRPRSAQPAKG